MTLITLTSRTESATWQLWQGRLLVGAGAALLPWMAYLAATLPPEQAVAWIALDTLEATALMTAGRSLMRGDGRHRTAAAGAALFLLADATADLLTSAPGAEFAQAVAMAVAAELPLAALCGGLALGWRGHIPHYRRAVLRGTGERHNQPGPARRKGRIASWTALKSPHSPGR